MAEKMLIKFEKYWNVMHGVVGVTAVLDPRYKLEILEFYFDKIFGQYSLAKVEDVRVLCYDLLKEYHQKLVKDSKGLGESHSTDLVSNSEHASQYELLISSKKRKNVDFIKSELDHYLEEDVLAKTDGFDVLTWWKVNPTKYPTLQYMARDFLAIPASTVASESTFSTGGRVVSPHRNRLHPNTIEALMCAQNYLWASEMKGTNISLTNHFISAYIYINCIG